MTALQGFEWLAYLSFFAAAWLRTFRLIDGAQAVACGILAGLVLIVRGAMELNNSVQATKEAERLAEEAAARVAASEALAEEMRKMNEARR